MFQKYVTVRFPINSIKQRTNRVHITMTINISVYEKSKQLLMLIDVRQYLTPEQKKTKVYLKYEKRR